MGEFGSLGRFAGVPMDPAAEFTASAELRDKLVGPPEAPGPDALLDPDCDLASVVETAAEKLQRLEARRFGRTKSPRKTLPQTDTAPRTRHVPAVVKQLSDEVVVPRPELRRRIAFPYETQRPPLGSL